jgi:hypothetical protein
MPAQLYKLFEVPSVTVMVSAFALVIPFPNLELLLYTGELDEVLKRLY